MKKFFLFFLLISSINAQDKAILWLPNSANQFNEFISRIDNKNIKITIALPSLNDINKEKTRKNINEKKIDIINIPDGYPFISILYYPKNSAISYLNKIENNPYFFALRINYSAQKFKKDFGNLSGLVLPYGDIKKDYIQVAKSFGYSWMPSSLINNTTDFFLINVDSFTIVPFKLIKSSDEINNYPFYIIDDTLNISSKSIDMIIDIFSSGKNKYNFVEDLIKISSTIYITYNDFNFNFEPWHNYQEYLLIDEQFSLMQTLSKVRNDIMSFLNYSAKKTNDLMIRCSNIEGYIGSLPFIENKSQTEEEIKQNLEEIYQIMGKTPPDFIYNVFSKNLFENEKFAINISTDSLIYYSLKESTDTSEISISTFSISSIEENLFFTINLNKPLLSNYCINIYIDINRRPGYGSIKLLENKNEKIIHNNAWEYALNIKNKNIYIYQASYYKIIKIAEFQIDTSKKEIMFKIPKSLLRGNFINWIFIPLIYKKSENNKEVLIDGIFSKIDYGYIYPLEVK